MKKNTLPTIIIAILFIYQNLSSADISKDEIIKTTNPGKNGDSSEINNSPYLLENKNKLQKTDKNPVEKAKPDKQDDKAVINKSKENQETAEKQKVDQKKTRIICSIMGGGGITYPTGEIFGFGNITRYPDGALFFNASFGHVLHENGYIVTGNEFSVNYFSIAKSAGNNSIKTEYSFYFFKFLLGYRLNIKMFFAEAGLFYGIKVGDWGMKNTSAGVGSANTEKIPQANTTDSFGAYLNVGLKFMTTGNLSIDIGIRADFSFIPSYINTDRINVNSAAIFAGATYYIKI